MEIILSACTRTAGFLIGVNPKQFPRCSFAVPRSGLGSRRDAGDEMHGNSPRLEGFPNRLSEAIAGSNHSSFRAYPDLFPTTSVVLPTTRLNLGNEWAWPRRSTTSQSRYLACEFKKLAGADAEGVAPTKYL